MIRLALAVLLASPASAATVAVTPATYAAAIAAAKPGDVLAAAPGQYPRLRIAGRSWTPAVTLTAPDDAVFSFLDVADTSGLNIVGGRWANNTVAGTYGIRLTRASRVTIDRAWFTANTKGLIIAASTDIVVTNFQVDDASSDGVNVVDSQRVRITRGLCQGSSPYPGAHPDCVQLWSSGAGTPDTDVTVEGITAIGQTQGVTLFYHPDKGQVPSVRIRFLNNFVMSDMPAGIVQDGCTDCEMTGNRTDFTRRAKYLVNIVSGKSWTGSATGNVRSVKP